MLRVMPITLALACAVVPCEWGKFVKIDGAEPQSALVLLQRDALVKHATAESRLKADLEGNAWSVHKGKAALGSAEVPPVIHDLSLAGLSMPHALDVHQSPKDAMYQCASEYDEPKLGCAECTMNRTCTCDGFARFGYGSTWSQWKNVSGSVSCDSSEFGDPYTGHGKVCMCMPRVYTCATEWDTPMANCSECTMQDKCSCLGSVRMGYGNNWTSWTPTVGTTTCRVSAFEADPYDGHGKICQCQPSLDLLQKMTGETGVGAVLNSIIAIIVAYFIAVTLYNLFSGNEGSILHHTSEVLMSAMRLAPMLCAVFLAVIKRTATLTAENTELYWLPHLYLKVAVVCCAVTFIAQAAFYVYAEYLAQKDAATGQLVTDSQSRIITFSNLGQLSLTLMYLALIVTLVGIVFMSEPLPLYTIVGKTPVAPGTVCTIIIAAVYFAVYLALHVMKSGHALGEAEQSSSALEVMRLASAVLNVAPMICALFLAVQIAADWQHTSLPQNVEVCLYLCAVSLLMQVVLVLVTPAFAGANLPSNGSGGEVDFVTRSHSTFVVISFFRWVLISALYICAGVICCCFWTLQLEPRLTHLLIVLMAVFFGVFIVLWVTVTLRQLIQGGFARAIHILGIAKEVAMLCPMLVILILASWVHAHQMSNSLGEPGEPQGWVQDYMCVAIGGLIFMLLMVIIRGLSANQPTNPELDYNIMDKSTEVGVLVVLLPMIIVCASAVVIITGLFVITPATATGDGAWFAQ